ncbi:MAG: PP2C family protein-serine/threonine phosphatase [Eubacteriaceae bacterium]|nr:PP2C family protein-serine/threonine phosphatase [Eubacteriaceae bacterium]
MNRRKRKMSVNVIGSVVMMVTVFAITVSVIGFFSFTEAFKKEYAESTYHMADTAASIVNGDNVEKYLAGEEEEEYLDAKEKLDGYCLKMHVSIVYVIAVDRTDYGSFVSIFNSINNAVDDTSYSEWELGYVRETTNDEYRQKYQALYEQQVPYETVYRTKTTDGLHPHITTLVPVKDSSGNVVALMCIQRPIRELTDARKPYLISMASSAILLGVMAIVYALAFLNTNVVNPVIKISGEATRFARENVLGRGIGSVGKYTELNDLADSIFKMESDMVSYIENLTKATAERERIDTQLALASAIQDNSIPTDFPAFPDRTDFDIYGSMTPARAVGGDFYNFFLIDDDHLAIYIGDVSDKGIPAALFMMVTNILISDRTYMGGDPAEIMRFVNNNLYAHNSSDMFVTVWLGIVELSTGKVIATNAGHDDAVIYSKSEDTFRLFRTKHGLIAGVMPDMEYRNFTFDLKPGDKIFLYTDGVPEATDSENNLYTIEKMVEDLNRLRHESPQGILDGIHSCVNEFVGEAPQFDDLTMLCIELKEKQ